MRVLYYVRVIFVSFEALILIGGAFTYQWYMPELKSIAAAISLDPELLKWLPLAPAGIAAWVVRETTALLQQDDHTVKTLTSWSDYWRLKAHVWVSIVYAFVFAAMGLAPLALKQSTNSAEGLLLLVTSVVGQIAVAVSLLNARFVVKEFVVRVRKD